MEPDELGGRSKTLRHHLKILNLRGISGTRLSNFNPASAAHQLPDLGFLVCKKFLVANYSPVLLAKLINARRSTQCQRQSTPYTSGGLFIISRVRAPDGPLGGATSPSGSRTLPLRRTPAPLTPQRPRTATRTRRIGAAPAGSGSRVLQAPKGLWGERAMLCHLTTTVPAPEDTPELPTLPARRAGRFPHTLEQAPPLRRHLGGPRGAPVSRSGGMGG